MMMEAILLRIIACSVAGFIVGGVGSSLNWPVGATVTVGACVGLLIHFVMKAAGL